MKKTGVFYNEIMRFDQAPMDMNIGKGFDGIRASGLLEEDNIYLVEAEPIAEGLVYQVHTMDWLQQVKRLGQWDMCLYSAGSTAMALERVLSGELNNALALVGIGGHHARRDYAWGGCYVNHEALAILAARNAGLANRFAVIDTDTHHGDGTRDLFSDDDEVMHICYCDYGHGKGTTKVCLHHASNDEEFVRRFHQEVPPLLQEFRPDLILWFCGLDTHRDSYGTQALTEHCYPRLCRVLAEAADNLCKGRLVVRVGCNAPSHVAARALPEIVKVLAGLDTAR